MIKYQLNEKEFLKDLQGLMEINSINHNCGKVTDEMPLGEGVYKALEYVLSVGKRMGFKTKMLDGYCGWIEMGEGEEMIAILGHVDVVPVEENGWDAPAFGATVLEGKVYGRGICDDKGPTMLSLYAMKALQDSGAKINKRIRLIIGGDEESGAWVCMKHYRKTEEIPSCAFSPDGDYPATYAEKGILHVTISRELSGEAVLEFNSGNSYNIVPAHAEATYDGKEYSAEGKAAHASRPELGINAAIELCLEMKKQNISHPLIDLMAHANTADLGIDFSDEPSGSLTFNPAIIRADAKAASVKCDIRMPVTFKPEQVTEAISNAAAKFGFKAESDFFLAPLYVEKDSALVSTLQRVYKECTGRDDKPIAVGGGTYARTFDNAVAFGPLLPGEENTNHKTNERWELKNIHLTFDILANVMTQL